MEPRLNFYQAGPDAMKAMAALEQQIARSGLEHSLVELVRLRATRHSSPTVNAQHLNGRSR